MASGEKRNLLHIARSVLSIPRFSPLSLMENNRAVAGVNIGHLWEQMPMLNTEMEALLALYREGKSSRPVDRVFKFADVAAAHRRNARATQPGQDRPRALKGAGRCVQAARKLRNSRHRKRARSCNASTSSSVLPASSSSFCARATSVRCLIEAARPLSGEIELMRDELGEQRLGPMKSLAMSYLFEIGHVTVSPVSV